MEKVWIAVSIGILFIIIGILCVLYAHRFGKWWVGFIFENKLILSLYPYKGLSRAEYEKKRFETWPRRGFWLFWLWGIRIM